MIGIVDYGAGNLGSLGNALDWLGASYITASGPKDLAGADKILLPGVGNFGSALASLRRTGLEAALRERVREGTPFLGICLGFQLLFEGSEESLDASGLGLLGGRVERFTVARKVPQIGWNRLRLTRKTRLFEGVEDGAYAYFVNSFAVKRTAPDLVAARSEYGESFVSAVECENVWAVQFHPEKSGPVGLQVLRNFVEA
ncbi:MAG: imidazole glycerol phosphate synthase subunit HisH [Candidatus Diapherotrites archaeon]|uniref:Imidazole glycerol phosphate synthase subunit HisH n=1 Tax=Candidatus Iainarchaeum sp. TaxID=3101447 RepID=A0A8T4L8N2_9ARCH|nr:imidazole glycerol phosphate synthase subunit HisH [Candidatus Diapherotrites archaeon]